MISIKIYRQYLYGLYEDVYTDQKSLQYVFTTKKKFLRQRRWLELLKDCDISVLYHPDILSRMTMDSVSNVE